MRRKNGRPSFGRRAQSREGGEKLLDVGASACSRALRANISLAVIAIPWTESGEVYQVRELRRGARCVRPHFWHRYEVAILAREVAGCMSVVTVTIGEAQSSQTGAGNLREMQVIGSTDIVKQHYPGHARNTVKERDARRIVPL